VITTSKTVIPNIQQQTHKLAVLSKVSQHALQLWGRRKILYVERFRRKITESDMTQFMQEVWCTIHIKVVFML
jgi:hypothetical protein